MTEADLIAVVLVVGTLALCFALLRAQRKRHAQQASRLARTGLHEALYNALYEWLQVEPICRTMIEEGVATRAGLQDAFTALPGYDERKCKAVVGQLLRSQKVREVIAFYEIKGTGTPRRQAMASLLEWARFRKEFREDHAS